MIPPLLPLLGLPLRLDPEDLETLRKLQAAIDNQRLILDNLIYAMNKQVSEKYGIDLDETWELDLNDGTLRLIRKDTTEHGTST